MKTLPSIILVEPGKEILSELIRDTSLKQTNFVTTNSINSFLLFAQQYNFDLYLISTAWSLRELENSYLKLWGKNIIFINSSSRKQTFFSSRSFLPEPLYLFSNSDRSSLITACKTALTIAKDNSAGYPWIESDSAGIYYLNMEGLFTRATAEKINRRIRELIKVGRRHFVIMIKGPAETGSTAPLLELDHELKNFNNNLKVIASDLKISSELYGTSVDFEEIDSL